MGKLTIAPKDQMSAGVPHGNSSQDSGLRKEGGVIWSPDIGSDATLVFA